MARMVFDPASGQARPVSDSLAEKKAARIQAAEAAEPTFTRPVMVRMGAGLMEVETPVVEARWLVNFREPSTDKPGLVQTDDGLVYLVSPDGTRALLGGGGSGLPPQWTTDDLTGGVTGAGDGTSPVLFLQGGFDGDGETLEVRYPNGSQGIIVSEDSGLRLTGQSGDGDDVNGGNAYIAGGDGDLGDGNGGNVILRGGSAVEEGSAGDVLISGGTADLSNGRGGDIVLQPGPGDTDGGTFIVNTEGEEYLRQQGVGIDLLDGQGNSVVRASTSAGPVLGFFGVGPVAQPTGVGVNAPAIHAALVALGLITA